MNYMITLNKLYKNKKNFFQNSINQNIFHESIIGDIKKITPPLQKGILKLQSGI